MNLVFWIVFSVIYRPKWTMIVVKNRGCSRLFAKNAHQSYDAPTETIIDYTGTHKNWLDFEGVRMGW
jgi:hypothetical protein